jgi:hypothetical protein
MLLIGRQGYAAQVEEMFGEEIGQKLEVLIEHKGL